MAALLAEGFVVQNDCEFEFPARSGFFILDGSIYCLSNIVLSVTKVIRFVKGSGKTGMVKTAECSYNACVARGANILRYDYPHPDHRPHHHKHIFDAFNGGPEVGIVDIRDENEFPTLAEVVRELHVWHDQNADRLRELE